MNTTRISLLISATFFGGLILSACSKSSGSVSTESFTTVETDVITGFVNNTALPQYDSLVSAGTALNTNIVTLNSNLTDANLRAAQASWKAMRVFWEGSEGFLIGPVESQDYDPNSDTWPTDYHQMDSLLTSSNPLSVTDVQNLPQTLRGYHPIEYLIFGEGGSRTVADLDARKQQYLASLSSDMLNNNVKPLLADWTSGINYAQSILTAGASGNTVYPSKQAFFLDIVGDNGMAGICNEVGEQDENGKMYNPYISKDSTLAESPYSGTSLTDFKNNIKSVQLVYLGRNGNKGIKDLVAAKNKDLDNKIQAAITAAVNSFDNISGADNMRFEVAIFQRRTQILATMNLLNSLQSLLETDLTNFIKQYVQD
ncbi:MAG TPA: imelysin family protein [Puia sp.]|nr:imelysin family protein [Puia sp.]